MLEQTPPVINFYPAPGEYGCFSNFLRHTVFLRGKYWPISEHCSQAMKFEGTEHEEEVRLTERLMDAARVERDRKRLFRHDW
jgi:N-glycosidase YbiA